MTLDLGADACVCLSKTPMAIVQLASKLYMKKMSLIYAYTLYSCDRAKSERQSNHGQVQSSHT